MRTQLRVADLTVDQLQKLIKKTVQESVAEVMLEFLLTAQLEAEIAQDAELVEHARQSRKRKQHATDPALNLDD